MRGFIVVAALVASVSPVLAQTAALAQASVSAPLVAKRGATVFDNGANRIGTVLAVRDNGSVVINFRSARVTLPVETLALVNGKLTTSLSKAEVGKLN